ncbi:MAG: hypothetical protein ABIW47_00270 [Ginsengibacter sp.]|jgi:hypothetical protein
MLLTEIILQANSLTSLYQFYKEVMNLPVLFSDENTLRIQAASSDLVFEMNEEIKDPFYHIAFNIPSNKFEEAYEWFKPRVSFLWVHDYKSYVAYFTNWNAKSFYFYDSGGNILEMIARFDLDNKITKEFSGSSIVNISELGMVFPAHNFGYEVAAFMKKYSLHFFDKQPPGINFKVAGDDNGLFIIVPEGRDWSPGTGKKSVIFPLSVSFETEYGQFNWSCMN